MNVLLMVNPGIDFVALVFALFKAGATPVLIDPGMGIRRLLECIEQIKPTGMVAIPAAHAVRLIRSRAFQSIRHTVTVGRRWFWGGATLAGLTEHAGERFKPVATRATDTAAILFTSGSTGPAKGVVYQHGMFDAQIRMIQSEYGIQPGEVDLPGFPLFALFNVAMGVTTVIPHMNPSRPAEVVPERIVRAIRENRVTTTFGSPAMWRRVSDYCVASGIKLDSLSRILIAGAPVPWRLVEKMQSILPAGADVHTPYGATEALPVCSISGHELLDGCSARTREGNGICVGKPLSGMRVDVIRIDDEPIPVWSKDLLVPDGQVGELVASGPVVTHEYFDRPAATYQAKIRDGDQIRHRMGDVGYRDADGRIWFCGRKAHRVETTDGALYSVCCEAIFNEHPDVFRTALVGVGLRGEQKPVMVVETTSKQAGRGAAGRRLLDELRALGQENEKTASIRDFLLHPRFPVDVRHNAKINREDLACWAGERV
jgi:acyl-CoA synthetase (AMP-forming)/AMP-acid ligase II